VKRTNLRGANLPRNTTIIETILTVKLDHKALLKITRCLAHDLSIAVLKQAITSNFHLAITRLGAMRAKGLKDGAGVMMQWREVMAIRPIWAAVA